MNKRNEEPEEMLLWKFGNNREQQDKGRQLHRRYKERRSTENDIRKPKEAFKG